MRRTVLFLFLLPLLLVPALAGCGGSNPRSAVADAQKSLADVTRATLHVKLAQRLATHTSGFQLDGAFSVAPGEGPLADAVYTRPGGRSVHVLLDRTHGTIRAGSGKAAPLRPALLATLDGAVNGRTLRGIATYIEARKWVTHPTLTREGDLDRVTGGLDVARAVHDLLVIAALSDHPTPELTEADLARVNSLVSSSSFDLTETHDTHALRRLAIRFALKPEARADRLATLLGTAGSFVVALDHVGQPVRVPAS
jgi:hypothetical protein